MNKSIKTEIIINSSKERVWEVLTTFKDYPNWNPFLVCVEGELMPGRRLKNTMINDDKTFVFKPVVLTVAPYQYFDWLGSLFVKGIFDGHHYFEIDEINANQVKLNHGKHFSRIALYNHLKKNR